MTVELGALPVQARELAENYKQVQSFQQTRARSVRRMTLAAMIVAATMGLANIALAWAVASMLPLTRLVPVYLLVRQDGTIDSSASLSALPASQNQAVIRAALWQYVRLREGYSYDTAQYNYDVVSGMSAPTAKTNYQSWFNYPNPASPQVIIGKAGDITVSPISVAMLGAHVAQIRFSRMVQISTSKPEIKTWTATLTFQQADTLTGKDRLANPGGLIVIDYQSTEDSAP
jgi:type IV secretion system protein VirB8